MKKSKSIIGTCALCKAPNSTLLKSHIIPEFFYTRIYTKTHKFTVIALDEEIQLVTEQKGYRENLLCAACETKLSKWEGKLSQFLNQVISDSYTTCSAAQQGSVTVVNGIDYYSVKMAVLSIFWRMSISKNKFFSKYKLGPYENDFRTLLDQEQVLAVTEYPIHLSKCTLDGSFLPGLLVPIGQGRSIGNLTIQSVVLNGIVFDCFMTRQKPIPEEVVEFSIQPNGQALIPIRSYEQLGINLGDFAPRMKSADMKNFYQKHQ